MTKQIALSLLMISGGLYSTPFKQPSIPTELQNLYKVILDKDYTEEITNYIDFAGQKYSSLQQLYEANVAELKKTQLHKFLGILKEMVSTITLDIKKVYEEYENAYDYFTLSKSAGGYQVINIAREHGQKMLVLSGQLHDALRLYENTVIHKTAAPVEQKTSLENTFGYFQHMSGLLLKGDTYLWWKVRCTNPYAEHAYNIQWRTLPEQLSKDIYSFPVILKQPHKYQQTTKAYQIAQAADATALSAVTEKSSGYLNARKVLLQSLIDAQPVFGAPSYAAYEDSDARLHKYYELILRLNLKWLAYDLEHFDPTDHTSNLSLIDPQIIALAYIFAMARLETWAHCAIRVILSLITVQENLNTLFAETTGTSS